MQIEVCVYSLASAITAERAGVDRIELCGGQSEGGTTPSLGLIKCVRAQVSIPIHVMIRPRGGDFLYSETELEVMRADIDAVKDTGVNGIVLGILLRDGTVDEERTREIVEVAKPLPVTFHRAFDMTRDPQEALESIIRTGAQRILTSGQQPRAMDGVALLHRLVSNAAGRIEIMAGAGISEENACRIAATGVQALHMSASSKTDSGMLYRNPRISMTSAVPSEHERIEAGQQTIQAVRRLVLEHNSE